MRVGEASLRNSQGFWIVSSTGWWWKARSKRWSDLSFSFSHRTRSPFPTCPAAWEQHDRPAAGGAPRARPPTQPSAAEIKVSLLAFSWKVLGIFILTSSICFCNPSPCAGKVGFPGTWVALVCVADEENVFLLVNGEADGGAELSLFFSHLLNLGPWADLLGTGDLGNLGWRNLWNRMAFCCLGSWTETLVPHRVIRGLQGSARAIPSQYCTASC